MLKTNSKKTIENLKAYIITNFTPENYTTDAPETFPEIARFIYGVFGVEKWNCPNAARLYGSECNAFIDWCEGLPGVLDTCYYYNRSAVDDLGAILEETDAEKSKYTESDAERLLSMLIYRTIKKGV